MPMKRTRTSLRRSPSILLRMYWLKIRISPSTSASGRCQFSVEKA